MYNNGNPFPQVLKELLFLAGESCYVIDWGYRDTQEELQELVRGNMKDNNKEITRPFYIFDSTAGTYLFIYLDEGDNPIYYIMDPYEPDAAKWLEKWDMTIQDLVNHVIACNKESGTRLKVNADDPLLIENGLDGNGSMTYRFEGDFFIGIIAHYEAGRLIAEYEYDDGFKWGLQRSYYPDGLLRAEWHIGPGGRHGWHREWDKRAKLTAEKLWINGAEQELNENDPNVTDDEFIVNGKMKYRYIGDPFKGIMEYYENDLITGIYSYENGRKCGIQKDYYPGGIQLKAEWYLGPEGMDGWHREWDEQGNLTYEKFWTNGVEQS